MSRPDGEVVAPLPGAVHDHDCGAVIVDVTCELGRTRVACFGGAVAVTTWDPSGEWVGTGSASAEHLLRVLHDAGQLDAYRERCVAECWARIDEANKVLSEMMSEVSVFPPPPAGPPDKDANAG